MFGADVVCLDKADGGENRRNQQWSNVLLRVTFSNVSCQSCGNSFLYRRPTAGMNPTCSSLRSSQTGYAGR